VFLSFRAARSRDRVCGPSQRPAARIDLGSHRSDAFMSALGHKRYGKKMSLYPESGHYAL
jgi:hypothetical protein